VFENILHQTQTVNQLKADIESGSLAPSILFSGPEYAGKATAALELARVLGCENGAMRGGWNCSCPSCVRHRNLVSPDLLILGRRRFFAEIAASSDTFLRNTDNTGSRMLFLRSVRKLLARFNGVLWEDDPKLGKLKDQIGVLEEELEDVETISVKAASAGTAILVDEVATAALSAKETKSQLEKKCESIIKKAAKLETDGLGELIPIAQIRRAAYWSRLAPLGKHKCVIIENAENMQEGAKNSLLKILEEPPPHFSIILTSSRPKSLLPTMLSRLREYRFVKRKPEEEAQVLNRIFRESYGDSIESYLASFLPVKSHTLFPLGAFFAASVAAEAVRERRARGQEPTGLLTRFGKFAAQIAEEGDMGRPAINAKSAIEKVLGTAEGFEIPGLFLQFLQQCSAFISAWLRCGEGAGTADNTSIAGIEKTLCADLWRKELNRSKVESDSFNITPIMALERLFESLKTGMV